MTLPKLHSNFYLKLIVPVFIFALFVGRKINLSYYLDGVRTNNYLDIVVDARYVLLVVFTMASFVYLYGLKRWISLYIGLMALLVGYASLFNEIVFHRVERFVLITSLIIACYGFYRFVLPIRDRIINLLLYTALGLPLFFDHFLISESSGVFFLIFLVFLAYLIKQNNSLYKSMLCGLLGFLGLQCVVAIVQIISGHSVGLSILGEPIMNIQTQRGLAAEILAGHKFLRGYGLFIHPNIAGFVGTVSLLFFTFTTKLSQRLQSLGLVLGGLVVVISFSRMAWISGILILAYILGKSRVSNTLKYLLIATTTLITASIFFFRFKLSDVYRFADIQTFFDAYSQTTFNQKVFGVGLGGYPFFLQYHFPNYEVWQYQPVHNVPLLLIIELGILPLFGILFILYIWQKMKSRK